MKLTDRTDLSPETIALYQRLEAERYPKLHPLLKGVMLAGLVPTAVITAGLLPLFAGALALSPLYLLKTLTVVGGVWLSPWAPIALLMVFAGSPSRAKVRRG